MGRFVQLAVPRSYETEHCEREHGNFGSQHDNNIHHNDQCNGQLCTVLSLISETLNSCDFSIRTSVQHFFAISILSTVIVPHMYIWRMSKGCNSNIHSKIGKVGEWTLIFMFKLWSVRTTSYMYMTAVPSPYILRWEDGQFENVELATVPSMHALGWGTCGTAP